MDKNIELAILRSEDLVETAKDNVKIDRLLVSVTSCYYACFWLAKALISKKEIFVKTHKGVKSKFSELYIKTGIIPEIYGKTLSKLMDYRQDADYDLEPDFKVEEVQEMITWTEDFLSFVKENIDKL